MKEENKHRVFIGFDKNHKSITKYVDEDELKELNKPIEKKKNNCKYDPDIITRKNGQYYNTMYGK